MPNRPLRRTALLLVLAALVTATGCRNDFSVEQRETPVHVWLHAPDLAPAGGTVNALIYVGSEKVVEGPVRFPPGVLNVEFPTVFMPAGANKTVSVVLNGGEISATDRVNVSGDTWVQISVRGRRIEIKGYGREPYFNR